MIIMPKKKKEPWIAAILNFFFCGLGYVYNGERRGFGLGITIAAFLEYFGLLAYNVPDAVWTWLTVIGTLMCLVFAYDGYKDAEKINKRK